MIGSNQKTHQNSFTMQYNPQDNPLLASRFSSPTLKIRNIKSCRFIYQSPSRVERRIIVEPLTFRKQAHKLTVRKLPQFHNEIKEDDPLKNSKIIENINFFRQQERKKYELTQSQIHSNEMSKAYNREFEVSRIMVNVKSSQSPISVRTTRSVSCTLNRLDGSRMSVINGLKSSESLFHSIVQNAKKQETLNQSRFAEQKNKQSNLSLAESQYFSGILNK